MRRDLTHSRRGEPATYACHGEVVGGNVGRGFSAPKSGYIRRAQLHRAEMHRDITQSRRGEPATFACHGEVVGRGSVVPKRAVRPEEASARWGRRPPVASSTSLFKQWENAAMRLTSDQVQVIRQIAQRVLGDGARVSVFGSGHSTIARVAILTCFSRPMPCLRTGPRCFASCTAR